MQLDQPLSSKEFDELDRFLMSERCPDDCMTMDALHGFLTAVVIGPRAIMMSEWLPYVWGDDPDAAPKFKNEGEANRIMQLLARYMNEIAITFQVAPREFEAVFIEQEENGKSYVDGSAWAWGFLQGMSLCDDEWSAIAGDPAEARLRPIMLLGDDDPSPEVEALTDSAAKCDQLSRDMEQGIHELHRFWLQRRAPANTAPQRREAPKIGRNDDCPCGSGKKFKKCCGEKPETLH